MDDDSFEILRMLHEHMLRTSKYRAEQGTKSFSHLRRKRNRFQIVYHNKDVVGTFYEPLTENGYITTRPFNSDKMVISITRKGLKAARAMYGLKRL